MGIAMHLAIPEQERVVWAKKIYDVLSSLKATMATPTMSNARLHIISYPAVSLIVSMIP